MFARYNESMKRFTQTVFCALAVLFALFPLGKAERKGKAEATNPYAYVKSAGVVLYEDEALTVPLFSLPQSYYVCILETKTTKYKAEYLTDQGGKKKVVGYVKKSNVEQVDYVPKLPYLFLTLTLTYRLDDPRGDFSTLSLDCTYYGDLEKNGTVYSYVFLNGAFGYIPRPADLSYPYNDEYDQKTGNRPVGEKSKEKGDALSPVQITLIVLLCLAVLSLSSLLLKPQKKTAYDGEEF